MIDRPKQPHNKWKIFFAISFALNIALLSAIGGATFQYAKSQSSYDTKFKKPQIGSVYLRALNQNQRRELHNLFRLFDLCPLYRQCNRTNPMG